jgi:hypothetical protein
MVLHMSSSLSASKSTHGTCKNTWDIVWFSPSWTNYLLSCVFNLFNLSMGVKKILVVFLKAEYQTLASICSSLDMLRFTEVDKISNIRIKWNER